MTKIYLLALLLIIKSTYIPLNKRKSRYYWKLKIDDQIPFISIFIVPYLYYFVWLTTTIFILWNTAYIFPFLVSCIISYITGGIFWYLIPNGVARPVITETDFFSKLTAFIYKIDNDTNGFPSAHIFITLICGYYLFLAYPANLAVILLNIILISISTILVKQHYILDVLGGLIFFILSIVLTYSFRLPILLGYEDILW